MLVTGSVSEAEAHRAEWVEGRTSHTRLRMRVRVCVCFRRKGVCPLMGGAQVAPRTVEFYLEFQSFVASLDCAGL